MYIPDLFGAYVKGRELAISKNWDDLKNYESVENARNQNDLSAMDIWERRQQMPGKMSMFYNQAKSSDMAMELLEAAQRGRLAQAHQGSDVAVGQYGVYKAYEPEYIQTLGDTFGARIGQQANAVQNLLGQNAYLAPIARKLGEIQSRTGANQIYANGVIGDNLVNAAQQGVTLSNQAFANNVKGGKLQGMQYDSLITQQPLAHENAMDALGRVIPARNATKAHIDAANTGAMSNSQIGSLISLAQQGDEGAAWQLKQAGYNKDGSLLSAQTTQDLTGADGQTATPQTNIPVWSIRSLLPPMFQTPNGGVAYNYPISPEYGSYSPTAPQTANVNGQTNSLMTPVQEPHRAGTASLVPPAYDPNLWSNYQKVAGYSGP